MSILPTSRYLWLMQQNGYGGKFVLLHSYDHCLQANYRQIELCDEDVDYSYDAWVAVELVDKY